MSKNNHTGSQERDYNNCFSGSDYLVRRCCYCHQLDSCCGSFGKDFFTFVTQSKRIKYPIICASPNTSQMCPSTYPTTYEVEDSSAESCPEYFQWIHEDLKPWRNTGITRAMLERSKTIADIRIVIVNGTVYIEKYREVYETRDVFTVWGVLQLLRLYPGKIPDLDLMFQCNDKPNIKKNDYRGVNATKTPPLFHYCGDESTLDIVFPDWSFWGWPEINIRPWTTLKIDLENGNSRIQWEEREPYAYWKGNVEVSKIRSQLLKCNATSRQNWNARIYNVAWKKESLSRFNNTKLEEQCTHRYKIYVEGVAWSVSEKYILACDSMSLLITPHYYDFYTRSLLPMIHYWPIKENHMCRSIKYAVNWGNKHMEEAQEIGKAGSKYIQENLRMEHVYDYMFHLLNAYAALQKYKVTIPPRAMKICSETMACKVRGMERKFKLESLVSSPAERNPCTMPPPFDPPTLRSFLQRKANLTKKVEMLEANGEI
ncbi:uncharacterized protein LOC132300938 [Cornus florida]|uniref:uncharacterized protein LOC132300938 n=1 Tax=Cornus florida TaxID=4283 RepID=UPI002897B77F|nr:uncharacterized protein LOC132300938 [Cornus florida]